MKDARELSLNVLINFNRSNFTIDRILDDEREDFSLLSLRDIALSKNLIYGVLRWQGKLDWIISVFSKTPLNKIDPEILSILRLGVYQITELDKIPVSAAVNTSVEMAKDFKKGRLKGFVNGVLRNISRNKDEIEFPQFEEDPVKYIVVNYSYPDWLINRWIDRSGIDKTLEICSKINEIPQITIRPNSIKKESNNLSRILKEEVENLKSSEFSNAISFTNPQKSIPELSGFQEGLFQVQDEAAQLVCEFLNPDPFDSVLDACAGIGGKTSTIAQFMNNKGDILAVDNVKFKLDILNNEMHRLGISIVKTEIADLSKNNITKKFDKILIDAPCSGSGVIRRNPDTKWSLSISKINKNSKRQLKILNNVSKLLKVGGVLVYSVCSVEKEENEDVIKKFLNKNSDFRIDSFKFFNDKANSLIKSSFLKTSVLNNNMDGFFAVRLTKVAL
jgi:16S rRNA (cytosine967-C5)-methyltransferase